MGDKISRWLEPTFTWAAFSSLEHDKSLIASLHSSETEIYQRQNRRSHYKFLVQVWVIILYMILNSGKKEILNYPLCVETESFGWETHKIVRGVYFTQVPSKIVEILCFICTGIYACPN